MAEVEFVKLLQGLLQQFQSFTQLILFNPIYFFVPDFCHSRGEIFMVSPHVEILEASFRPCFLCKHCDNAG